MVESTTVVSGPSPPFRKLLSLIIYIFAGLAILVAITAVAAPWAFSNTALRNEIAAQIRRVTGLAANWQGRAVFVVLPQPHISIEGVSFADPSGALRIDARYFKGYVRLAPLFAGRIEIASATLGQPDMQIDLDRRPMPEDSVIGRAADASRATAEAASADAARLGAVTLVDGRARLISKQLSPDLSIDAINLTLDWRKLRAAAIVTGQARNPWRERRDKCLDCHPGWVVARPAIRPEPQDRRTLVLVGGRWRSCKHAEVAIQRPPSRRRAVGANAFGTSWIFCSVAFALQ